MESSRPRVRVDTKITKNGTETRKPGTTLLSSTPDPDRSKGTCEGHVVEGEGYVSKVCSPCQQTIRALSSLRSRGDPTSGTCFPLEGNKIESPRRRTALQRLLIGGSFVQTCLETETVAERFHETAIVVVIINGSRVFAPAGVISSASCGSPPSRRRSLSNRAKMDARKRWSVSACLFPCRFRSAVDQMSLSAKRERERESGGETMTARDNGAGR